MPAMAERFRRTAVVTGASSGIGAATARALAAADFAVVCAARRIDRLRLLADEIGATAVECDVTFAESVSALAEAAGSPVHVLVNNAGGAFGQDAVADADPDDWRRMYEVNVLGTLHGLPGAAAGAACQWQRGGRQRRAPRPVTPSYEGGAGYTAAKHAIKDDDRDPAARARRRADPVHRDRAGDGAHRGVRASPATTATRAGGGRLRRGGEPLTADDVADAITWVATRPAHVDVDLMVLRPRAQAAQHKVHREP
jgi:NADP-dependent 3-hydroxy acid dehydrogenase YdfG